MPVRVSSEKSLGMWGAILGLIGGFIPYIGGVVSLVGEILVLVALKGISDAVGDDRPFRNYLYSLVFAIGALVILSILLLGVFAILPGEWVPGRSPGMVLAALFVLLLVALIIGVAHFQRKAWTAMYEITGTKEFLDAAKWTWWGALTALLIVGLILLVIARVFVILAFSKMPDELETGGFREPSQGVVP